MKDLTEGPIPGHVVAMAVPIAAGMLIQTLYFFVDLYFVSRLGDAAIAGVGSGGNLMFVVFALSQMLGVGTVVMVSHAVGRKDQAEANHAFNQAIGLTIACTLVTLVGGYSVAGLYMGFVGADTATTAAGVTFLHWLIPGLALQYAIVVMSSGLRGTGIVKPAMVTQALTLVANIVLAPILIAGWGTGHPMGVAGAGLATTLATAVGVAVLLAYFLKLEHYVAFDLKDLKPQVETWGKLLKIGLPAGGEFLMIGLFVSIMYWVTRDFGAATQAGFGIGTRVMQMVFLPAMALAFAASPVAGQNFGAKKPERVRQTFRTAATQGAVIMALITAIVQWNPSIFARPFTSEPAVIAACAEYLSFVSWNFVAVGIVFTCSSLFQALGNTWPSLASSAFRLLLFSLPTIWVAHQPGFELRYVYIIAVMTMLVQALVSWFWLQSEMDKRLRFEKKVPG
jgi:putative MATE family efflux protein